jgi:hypothetical protein
MLFLLPAFAAAQERDPAREAREPKAALARMPVFALKTNLLYDAAATMNLGAELRLSRRLTMDVPVNWNPWKFSGNRQWRHVMVQPELRYWIYEPFNGHFLGPHLLWSFYNVGGVSIPEGMREALGYGDLKNHRYQGSLYGAGASYGYHWMLSNRLSLEATAGFGYVYLDYGKYNCAKCGEKIEDGTRHYFGPTKLGLSLVFMIK